MCGIICMCSINHSNHPELLNKFQVFKENIIKRGPDSFGITTYRSENVDLLFGASVLWLQGQCMTSQPLEDDKCVLVYNGDIFGGLSSTLTLEEVLSQLQGPYAFIFFDKVDEKLYFGRDLFGRRSLLIGKQNEVIILTSVAKRIKEFDFIELPSIGTFCLNVKTNELRVFPWMLPNENFKSKLKDLEVFLGKKILVQQELESYEYFKFKEPTIEQLQIYKDLESVDIQKIFDALLSNPKWLEKITTLQHLLENAMENRILRQPKYCKNCMKEKKPCCHALTGVLFSGGVDCAILALLADKFVDKERPIDLINVAFAESNNYQTPDRLTGLQTLEELKHIRPEREWHFLKVDVPHKELDKERSENIADLIYPLQTVLDDSLGCALWFASRGKQGSTESPCRLLLVGMGADELFGGYTRHRAAFKKKDWVGLHEVLVEDWQNLPYRNLARDDRVVSDHGRQLRTPYLDENFVQFVCSLNCWEKTYPCDALPHGIGEKILLRSLAYYMGLKNTSTLKKRALQFGSRIANKKENAHDISPRLYR